METDRGGCVFLIRNRYIFQEWCLGTPSALRYWQRSWVRSFLEEKSEDNVMKYVCMWIQKNDLRVFPRNVCMKKAFTRSRTCKERRAARDESSRLRPVKRGNLLRHVRIRGKSESNRVCMLIQKKYKRHISEI